MTAPTVFAKNYSTRNTGTSSYSTLTLPSSLATGDKGLLLISSSGNQSLTGPSGWTQVGGNPVVSNANSARLFTKDLDASDSGDTVSYTFGASQRSNSAVIVVRDGLAIDDNDEGTDGTTPDTSFTYPDLTTTVADCLLLNFATLRFAASTTTGCTQPSGWFEEYDFDDAAGATPRYAIDVMSKTATSSGSQTGPAVTTASSATKAYFAVAISPVPPPAGPTFIGWGQPL